MKKEMLIFIVEAALIKTRFLLKHSKALTEEELQNFFKALYSEGTNYTYQVFFSLMIATGCRIGEICSLSWEDVDFCNKRIHICKHYVQTFDDRERQTLL